ncbi:unnamed protein product [Urochloa humidicola]
MFASPPAPEHAWFGSLQLSADGPASIPAPAPALVSTPPPAVAPASEPTPTPAPFSSAPEPAPAGQPSPLPPSQPTPPTLTPQSVHSIPTADRTGPQPQPHRPVVGIAAGSAAAATILVVLALGFYLRKRRRGNHRAVPSGSSQHEPAANIYPPTSPPPAAGPREPAKQHDYFGVKVTPTPPTASSSDDSALATSSTISRESIQSQQPLPGPGAGGEVVFRGAFGYGELLAATDNFSDSNLVGRGGFGDVYVGTVDGGIAVAVKRLRVGSQQGDREFQAELRIINRVHHRNLVSLVGYCVADGGQRLLVYEFVPNMTLHHHLHGEDEAVLDWPTRWKIAVGAAKGLAYLHEDCHPRIIHRDIKSANILLDDDFNPKVSDFGMAKFIPRGDSHIATKIVGTIGYLAPEYASSGRLTEKSDVFSYGVVLLEIITGMNVAISSSDPDTEDTLVAWARPLLTQALELHNYEVLVDPLLESIDAVQMDRLVRCAAAAVSESPRRRPRMSQIVRHLEGDASAEEIDTCGVQSFVESGSVYGDASWNCHPVRYDEIRTLRREERVRKLHQS